MNSRPQRVGDQIRVEITTMLGREVRDPGLGFLTVTRVEVSADLQHAKIYYTTLGDEKARRESARGLERASPFLRRQLAGRIRLRRAPELHFFFDESVAHQDRIEKIILDLEQERANRPPEAEAAEASASATDAAPEPAGAAPDSPTPNDPADRG